MARGFVCDDKSKMIGLKETFKSKGKVDIGGFHAVPPKIRYTQNSSGNSNDIALRLNAGTTQEMLIGNASILPLVGYYNSYGHDVPNRTRTVIQELMQADGDFANLPFNVFEEASLDITSLEMKEQGGSEEVTREIDNPAYNKWESSNWNARQNGTPNPHNEKIEETEHFIGSMLFNVGGKDFLFDVDRVELGHKIFNPFLCELPGSASTVAEGYEMLKPDEVKAGEKAGLEIVRQGEWFFLPTTVAEKTDRVLTEAETVEYNLGLMYSKVPLYSPKEQTSIKEAFGYTRIDKALELFNEMQQQERAGQAQRFILRAGENRPNYATEGMTKDGIHYVRGEISHSGREHKTIVLPTWHIAMANTAQKSVTITGDID